jgi:hypothetical protein
MSQTNIQKGLKPAKSITRKLGCGSSKARSSHVGLEADLLTVEA